LEQPGETTTTNMERRRVTKGVEERNCCADLQEGDPSLPSNYRGVSLLCTAYKIYAELIKRRLEREVERREGLPETQMGFRRGRSRGRSWIVSSS